MTVPSTTNKWIYTGNGVATEFAYTKKIFAETDLVVELITIATGASETLTLTTDYTVSGVGDDGGGNVTLTGDAPENTHQLVIRRVIPITQEIEPVENDPNRAEVFEEAIDRGVMIAQQLQEQIDRSILQNPTQSSQVTLPNPVANRLLGWDAAGTKLENKVALSTDVYVATEAAKDAAETAQGLAEYARDAAIVAQEAAEAVAGWEIASKAEAEAGTDNTKLMTPLRTKEAITENELDINALDEKTTPADDDVVVIEDSADTYAKKKVKRSNLVPEGAGNYQVFTSSGTWVKPDKGTMVVVECWGGGGGGTNAGVPSGGGGGFGRTTHLLSDIAGNISVTVGSGGTKADAGGIGGTSNFGTLAYAYGGGGGNGEGGVWSGGGGGGTATAGATGNGNTGGNGGVAGGGRGANNNTVGENAQSEWGGGGGGGLNAPGKAVYGGGGGSRTVAGTSLYGGNGGTNATAPSAPAGGGAKHAGARGEVRVWVV